MGKLDSSNWDSQELSERSQEAKAIGIEDPDIYIDFAHDAITTSEKATQETRYMWDELLKGYSGKIDYSDKEEWQSKMETGDLNSTVKQGVAVIRKALRQPDWYSIDAQGPEDEWWASFLRRSLDIHLNPQHARFDTAFSDASELGFAIGQSHEIIPRWITGKGLEFSLVPPWQIYRDPDATPRDPWSGDYWDHVEWLDLWKVKQWGNGNGKEDSAYVRLDEVTASEAAWGQETQEKRARRKGQYYQRSSFRHAVRVIEHWGVVLDKQGELLLENARFTIAGDVLIRNPEPNPFVNLRWPGVSFSPLPDMFAFEGHGVLETSLILWLQTCNLMSLHGDDLAWRVNKLREVNRMHLEDPTNVNFKPGDLVLLSEKAPPGSQVLRDVYGTSATSETLATIQDWRQCRENASFVNQFVQGLPGDRSKITKGEVEIKTGQSMTIFDSIGEDIEEGACNVLKAAIEVLVLNWTEYENPSITRMFPNDPDALAFSLMPIEQRKELLQSNCDIKISGISAQIKNSELVPRVQWLMKQAESPVYGKYCKPYELLKMGVSALGFHECKGLATETEALAADVVWKQIEALAQQMEAAKKAGIPPEVAMGAMGGGNGGVPAEAPPEMGGTAPGGPPIGLPAMGGLPPGGIVQ